MSIYTAMRAGVAGLDANSSAMAAISDNIANLSTIGYKRNDTEFTEIINAQNAKTTYNAGGVIASTRQLVNVQGSIQATTSSTDLAVNGAGFFIVTNDPTATSGANGALYTRSGAFSPDANGKLVNSQGYYLLGAPITPGSVLTTPSSLAALQPIDLSNVGATATASTKVAVSANIDSRTDQYAGATVYAAGAMAGYPSAANSIQPQVERSIEVYDSLGESHTLNLGFLKTGTNSWSVEIYARPAADIGGTGLVASGTVAFTSSGTVASVSPALQAFTLNWAATTGAAAQPMTMDLSAGLTQYATTSSLNSATADGSAPGSLTGVTISPDGILTAQFSNGSSRPLYSIPVATFANPDGLQSQSGGAYSSTTASGLSTINSPNAGGAGSLKSAALEASNVDLGTEFTDLITTQRAYSACSKIITTADQMLQELIDIKR